MNKTGTMLGIIVLASCVGFVGCEREGPAERAGESVDKGVEKMGEGMEKAGENVKDAVN